jgi:hypothetical protein
MNQYSKKTEIANIESYSQEGRIKLGNEMLKKHRLYLDTKYWIFMRDASLGKASSIQIKIYEKLKDLAKRNIAICPLSPHIFFELMSISDKQKRLDTARAMDELSQQICFISPLNIMEQEILSFIRYCQVKAMGKPLFNTTKYVFTKIPFVMGEYYPAVEKIPHEQMNDIRIQFFDHLSTFTLTEMLKAMRGDFPLWNRENLVAKLNQGKDDNQNWRSFHEVFMHEIAGVLDTVKDEIQKVWIYIYENDTGCMVKSDEVNKSECVRLLFNLICHAFDQKKINKELPFFHINASLHAFLRYNKTQRLKENDLIDFSHAAWALPYCDMFLTEKPLHDWICNKPLRLNEIYRCKVLWKEEDVLNALESLEN